MASKKNKIDEQTIKEIDALFEGEKNKEETKSERQESNVAVVPMAFPVEQKKHVHIFDWCDAIGIRRILK